ncbi:MAG: cell division protein FtsQ [Lachnospiraceae bacterium]|nr:cell division protein FtsQ [Lachnospiraceae bacterium]
MFNREETERKSHIGLWIGLAAFLAVILAVVSMRVTTVTVTGNRKYTAEQIENLLFDSRLDRNSLYCYYENRFRPHKQIPFVEDYKIVFQGPSRVEVIVYEKSVVGYVSYMSSYMYFDKDGIIVESASSRLEGIPWITGLQFGQIVLNQPLPVANQQIFEQIMNLTQVLSVYEIQADQIRYDKHGNATLVMGEVDVYLGSNKDMNGKISELHDMLPELAGLSGTLYLDTYDETNSGMWYSFIKK